MGKNGVMKSALRQTNVMTRAQWLAWVEKQRQKELADIQEAQLEAAAPIWREVNERWRSALLLHEAAQKRTA